MAINIGTSTTGGQRATGQGGYGSGKHGDLTVSAETIVNCYAQVTNIAGKTITISGATTAGFGDFKEGSEILIHCVAYIGAKEYCGKRGKWKICRIKSVGTGGVLTLDQSAQSTFLDDAAGAATMSELVVQAITIPHFKNVTINSGGSITCPKFLSSTKYGGVVAFKCSGELNLVGGHIDLTNKGVQEADAATYWSHGWVNNEDPTSSKKRISAGWENFRTTKHLTLNAGDGAALIITKTLNCDENKVSRIGRPDRTGTARKRTSGSNGNLGGSSILLAAETINSWNPDMIAKYPTGTANEWRRGQARCYIATETTLPTDEGLYALDRISTPTRMADTFNLNGIKFGKGTLTNYVNTAYTGQLNSYAKVTSINTACTTFAIDENNQNNNGLATIQEGALILFHATKNGSGGYTKENGRCMFARVEKYADGRITISDPFKSFDGRKFDLTKYFVQVIAVPEFSYWKQEGHFNSATPAFNANYGGGVAVVAVKGTLNIISGGITVENKGNSGAPYGETGLTYIGNAQMAERLPLGEGHGSVLILANHLRMNTSTRIGASYSGKPLGGFNKTCNTGDPMYRYETNQIWEGGERGRTLREIAAEVNTIAVVTDSQGTTGGGQLAGVSPAQNANGGYGSNSTHGAAQGAHVLIIANSIENFCIDAISTGGEGGAKCSATGTKAEGENGGASHGGGGGSFGIFRSNTVNDNTPAIYRGGNGGFIGGGGGAGYYDYISGGGSGGFCFVYCNEFTGQNTDGISLD